MCYIAIMVELTVKIGGLSRRQLVIISGGVILGIALAILAVAYFRQSPAPSGLPLTAYKDLSFNVFFPLQPPQGFKLDRASISSTPQVLAYKYDYMGKKPVFVSVQPLDPQLDVNSFRPTREIDTNIGHGYLVEYDSRTTVAIVAGKSMVLINSPDGVSSNAIEQLADSLEPVK